MSTSLAEQLKRLAIPQTKTLLDSKHRPSLLFDPLEAAKLSKEAVYEIGFEGIQELVKIDRTFVEFKEALFNKDSKFMQRAVESKDVNRELDKIISRFLIRLSPYLLLKSAHKALEWLIFRYQIHELNASQLFSLILPYHEANIFVRILQLVDLKSTLFKSWTWLESLQKHGLTLPRRVLVNHAISDTSFLRFICESTENALEEHLETDTVAKLRTQLAFYTSALVGVFSTESTDDHVLTVALPSLINGLVSPVDDYKSASYMALGQLITNNQLEARLTTDLLKRFMEDGTEKFRNQRVYLLLLMFQRQDPAPTVTYEIIKEWDWVVPILAELARTGTLVSPLVLAMVEALLSRILLEINESSHDASAQIFCWNLIEKVELDDFSASKLLRVTSAFHEKLLKRPEGKGVKRKKSDDIVDEGNGQADWLKTLIETLCVKYAAAFDKILDQEFQSLRRLWTNEEQDRAMDGLIMSLIRKCSGPTHAEAWRQLKPLLLKHIDDKRYFKGWCKASPTSEPLTLILVLERLMRPIGNSATRKALLAKVVESPFGAQNLCILNLKKAFDENPDIDIQSALQSMLDAWRADAAMRFDALKWISAINELRNSGNISSVNDIWSYALQMVVASITSDVAGHTAVEIAKSLSYVATLKAKTQLLLISQLIACTKMFDIDSGWIDLSQPKLSHCLRIKILELCLRGIHDSKRSKPNFADTLSKFLDDCFPAAEAAMNFIGAVAAGLPYQCLTTPIVSPMLQIHAIHHIWASIKEDDGKVVVKVWDQFIIHLLLSICNESMSVRMAAVKLVKSLDGLGLNAKPLCKLLSELNSRSKEIKADYNHVSVGLFCFLSGKNRKRDTEFLVASLTSPEIPLYVAAKIIYLLETTASAQFMVRLAPLARRALEDKEDVYVGNKTLASYWEWLNPETVVVLDDEAVWGLAKDCLAHQKCDELCPAIRFIKAVNKDLFLSATVERQVALLELLVSTRAETESSPVSSAVAGACRKLPLKGVVVLPILEKMINSLPKSLNTAPSTVLEGRSWRLGISLLEIIQGKKKIQESKTLVRPLFTVLKFCLDQEEQTPFEYTKQLVLGCLLEVCERHLSSSEKIEEAILDVELIVQCLRASSNPQTHHHALLLLSCLGSIIPVQVMHNMMAIFTFMGSSVARLDDEHSVQVVTKVVDAIVPVLVQSLGKKTEDGVEVVAEVLRIFVWTLRDVPQHRRSPLFTRLITTLDPDRCLSIFLLLLFENYVVNAHKGEKNSEGNMPASLQLGMDLALSFGPKTVLNTAMKLIQYLIAIPLEKMNPAREETMEVDRKPAKSDGLFDIKKHTPKQLRHYTYTLITFLNSLLADQNLILQVRELDTQEAEKLENIFKDCIAALLLYAPTCSAQQHPTLIKYWKVVTSLSYDVLDRLVALISSDTLVGVITKLLKQSELALRRKAIDLLNVHVQTHRGGFTAEEKASLHQLVEPVLEVAVAAVADDPTADAQTIQQAALLSLRLLAKALASEDPSAFKNVLVEVSKLCKSKGFLLASASLTVADLVALMKARAVAQLHSFMPPLLKALAKYVDAESTDIVLMSVCAAMYRIVESLAAFLSPYMDKLIYCISCLATRWPDASDLNRKLIQIRQKLATSVAHRVLSPALTNGYKRLIEEKKFLAVGPLLSLLADSLSAVADVGKLLPSLSPFFFQVLQLRSDAADGIVDVTDDEILSVESHAIDSLMTLVRKLSELAFKPLYYQIFHWVSEHPHRAITFYRLSCKLAEGLKGLFVLFAGHFLNNAATLLDATNISKTATPHFGPGPENEARSILLLESVVKTLQTVFTFDSTQFLSKDKFQTLLSPLVDQLENTLGGAEALADRSVQLLTPCLAQMTLATDDTQWKQLNYQLLTKTRNPSPLIRIAALNTIVEVATKLGEDYLPLLPETIGTLAELLEDEDERVEEAMKAALRRMEDDLGQPIREYFQ